MTPQELKNSILQLAIQGKLVEQRPEEGTAEELYKQIQAEKQALIKAGKIKKGKPLPEITEDEKPFEIPESWMWVRLGSLLRVIGGVSYDKKDVATSGLRILRGGNIQQMKVLLEADDVFLPEQYRDEDKTIREGDILIVASTGSKAVIGKAGYVDRLIPDTMIGAFLRICRPYSFSTINYLRCLFDSDFYRKHIRELSQGTNINNVKESYITGFAIPLPPQAEQNRIVAKIEALLPLIERYEKAWSRLEDFNKRFPGDMQKSILQMAIQGKLVEQRPEEGTGEELYRRIQTDKQALIKAGKIKKEKPLPEITEDELPFEIPESWKWVRIGDYVQQVTDYVASGSFAALRENVKYYKEPNYAILVKTKDFQSNFTNDLTYTDRHGYDFLENSRLFGGELIMPNIGASIGKVFKVPYLDSRMTLAPNSILIRFLQDDHLGWFSYFFLSPDGYSSLMSISASTAQAKFSKTEFKSLCIPVPPLAEQKRIVTRLEELLPLCERLK